MAAQAYAPESDPEDPPPGQQQLSQATTVAGREGAPWDALYTALYWARGSPNGPDTPEPTETLVRQAKAMRIYDLQNPLIDSPPPLPWPTDPLETVQKLADLTQNRAKATMQTPAETPAAGPCPAGYTPLLPSPAPPGPTTSSPAQASTKRKTHTRP